MKRLKYILSLLLFVCWLPTVAQSDIEITDSTVVDWGGGIGGGITPNLPTDPVTNITLSQTSITLEGGERIRLTALTNSTAANKKVIWSVFDESVATVSSNGTVMGMKTGTTTVTATSVSNPEISATCKVTVVSDYVAPSSGWILPWGKDEAWTMKYKYFEQANYVEPANDAFGRSWKDLNYNDASWETLTGPMGSENIWYGSFNYVWYGENNYFCLRRSFYLPVVGEGIYTLQTIHDDGIEVYLNGQLIAEYDDWTHEQVISYVIPNEAFVAGENMLAIYIKQGGGDAYLDYGLYYNDEGEEEKDLAEIIVHADNGGIVNGAGIYNKGTEVTLTAIPNDGYRFVQWSDGTTANPYIFELHHNIELTAYFEPVEGGFLDEKNIVSIVEGTYYVFYTDREGIKRYLHAADYNNWTVSETPQTLKFTNGNVTDEQAFANAASFMESNGYYMSNVAGWDGTGPINTVEIDGGLGSQKRIWESQVFYKNDEGKHAIRLTNTIGTDWGCHLFVNIDPTTLEVFASQPSLGDALYLWELEKSKAVYKVYYYIDGKLVHTAEVVYGEKIPEYVYTPTKEGHTFSGWSEIPETMPAENVTVTGSFTVNKYQLTYTVDGEVYHTDSIAYGTVLTAIDAPVQEGRTFSGWCGLPETMPAKDVTVSGSFVTNGYTLTYVVDGKEYRTFTVEYGATITAEAEPTKEGHTFSGWSEIPETMPAENVTVTGSFTVNKYLLTYTVDGEVYHTDTIAYGTALTAIDAPTKEGCTFSGWSELPETMPANDVTVSGSFVTNGYTLTYVVDGKEYKTFTVEYGATITAEAEPTKEGHTFSGWSEIPETMPAENVTVTGSFTVNKYLVTFKIDDEVIVSDSLEYGTTIVAPEAPEKEGYTFDGWGEVAETVPASDVTYEGTYIVNIYKVYYYVGEELVHTAEVAYGELIPEYVYEPTEEGYTFLGWVGNTYETMPAHDVTYTANMDDAIEQLTINKSQLTIYDLTGRKVTDTENLRGGIYIVNGIKVVIK